MIVFAHDAQGGFTAGDTLTGLTAYAYPTSDHAENAAFDPETVAAEMLSAQTPGMHRAEYDARHWSHLS